MWLENNEADIPQDYGKLKQQNIKLRNELKQINEFLSKQIEKKQDQQISQRHQLNTTVDLREDTLKAELLNAQKQIKIQLKQIQILQNRQELLSLDNIVQLQSQVKKLMDKVKELEQENKILISINGKQEKKLVELSQDDYVKNRIDQLESENQFLKQKVIAQSKAERSQSVQITKVEPILKPIQLSQKQQELMKEKDLFISQMQTKLQEQDKHINILKNLKNQYDKQIGHMAHRIKQLETQLLILGQQLQDKNSELNKKNHLLPNLSARNQRNQQQRINLSVDNGLVDQPKTQIQINQQYSKLPSEVQSKRQPTLDLSSQTLRSQNHINNEQNQDMKILRIEQVGQKNQQEFHSDIPQYFRLHNLKLWWKEDYLQGLQAYYHNANQIVNGQIFCLSNLEELNQQSFELHQSDWIHQIGFGFENDKIKFVKIISNQNCVLKFGSEMEKIQEICSGKNEIMGTIEVSFNQSSIGLKVYDEKLFDKI
ncbi:unnamed protein product (macronuclear) [Paramecium tetraurelia]|uniref:Uncharacterized protein n=1 Tax=Paramecium tetraurelia TaxID=5888 RepID=A0DWW6_PARTE|nr:uncharacterized protein GSPATT00021176001 [Paramecium tetraurelia]CAK87533.1 unnamed protein product [Paramecium tetraurelia]|eukprot:XP_001454930.1 hypothetical protein (macronuclear) [Paramecium tetraurelia strain d4-2]